MEDVFILSAVRTPIGSFLGALKDTPAPQLMGTCIKTALQSAQIKGESVEEALVGCVLPAGMGQAPARQAVLSAGLPQSITATTVNRVCGSGLKTVLLASQIIQSKDADVVLAGGMENMSRSPFLLERAREGYRLGNGKLIDSMIHDGLWDPYKDVHMGNCAELCAKEYRLSREEQDRFAVQSYQRALSAIQTGKFKSEIVPIEVQAGKEKRLFDSDEEPSKGKLDKFKELKPAFQKDGTITAANASSLSDGASALVLASGSFVKEAKLKPIARVLCQASYAQAPEWFTTAPVGAVKKLLKKASLAVSAIDLFEINEAFSAVALACAKDLTIPEEKLNIRGGAVALGHPIGASGARILTTLLHSLQQEKKRLGVAAICIGGGEASSILVEVLS